MDINDDSQTCDGCLKKINEGNRALLGCPAWKSYSRWKQCFEGNEYIWGYWSANWAVFDIEGNLCHSDLDMYTPKPSDFINIWLVSSQGSKFRIKVNKYKTFHALEAIMRFKICSRMAFHEGISVDKFIQREKTFYDNLYWRFKFGDTDIWRHDKLLYVGDGVQIDFEYKCKEW